MTVVVVVADSECFGLRARGEAGERALIEIAGAIIAQQCDRIAALIADEQIEAAVLVDVGCDDGARVCADGQRRQIEGIRALIDGERDRVAGRVCRREVSTSVGIEVTGNEVRRSCAGRKLPYGTEIT